jgi:two-component system response regulator (stage 0 sporulation protein F)
VPAHQGRPGYVRALVAPAAVILRCHTRQFLHNCAARPAIEPAALLHLSYDAEQSLNLTKGVVVRREDRSAALVAMAPPASRARILVVDDDSQITGLLEIFLTHLGYDVQCARCGSEALQTVPAYEPDVVLLDVHMPGMSGHEVLSRLHEERHGMPVILITGDQQVARRTIQNSTVGLLIKPFNLSEVAQAVAAALRTRTA